MGKCLPQQEITQKEIDDLERERGRMRWKYEMIGHKQAAALRKAARTGELLKDVIEKDLPCTTCGSPSQSYLTGLCNECMANLVPVTEKINGNTIPEEQLELINSSAQELQVQSILNAIGFGVLSVVTIGMIFVWMRILF